MPDRDADERRSTRLLTALVWGGVALAPVAVLVALLGGSEASLRFALLLLAIAVVLVGASMLIRNDPVLLRLDIEDRIAEATDELREQLRDELAASIRATHQQVLPDRRVPSLGSGSVSRPREAGSAPVPPSVPRQTPQTMQQTMPQQAPQQMPSPVPQSVPARAAARPAGAAVVARAMPAQGAARPAPAQAVAQGAARPAQGAARPGAASGVIGAAPVARAVPAPTRAYDDAPHGGYPDSGGRGDRSAGTGQGRRSRRHRSSDDDYDAEPRRHGAPEPDRYTSEPDRYTPEPDRYEADPPARPLEQGDWRDPAGSYDDYGRW